MAKWNFILTIGIWMEWRRFNFVDLAFVLCRDDLREWHRNSFPISRKGRLNSPTFHVLTDLFSLMRKGCCDVEMCWGLEIWNSYWPKQRSSPLGCHERRNSKVVSGVTPPHLDCAEGIHEWVMEWKQDMPSFYFSFTCQVNVHQAFPRFCTNWNQNNVGRFFSDWERISGV